MRMIVIRKPGDLQGQLGRLLKSGRSRTSVPLDTLRELNPHVDFARIEAGTVLLVPEHPDFEGGQSSSIGGEAFDGIAKEAMAGLDAAAARLRAGLRQQEAERKETSGVLQSAAFKRLAEGDEALRKQAGEVEAQLKADAKRTAEAADTLTAMEKALKEELAALSRRFG